MVYQEKEILPNYTDDDLDFDTDIDTEDDIGAEVSDSIAENVVKSAISSSNQSSSNNQNNNMVASGDNNLSTPFGDPVGLGTSSYNNNSSSFYSGSTAFGSFGNNNSSFNSGFGSNNRPTISFGNDTYGKSFNNLSTNNLQINREKRLIICNFLDCIVETYQSKGVPGYLPSDIYDLTPRIDVWRKLSIFNIEKIYIMVPTNIINLDPNSGWNTALNYFGTCLSKFLHIPTGSCAFQYNNEEYVSKAAIMKSLITSWGLEPRLQEAVSIGILSGKPNQSDRDKKAAEDVGVDYLDLYDLLKNMN